MFKLQRVEALPCAFLIELNGGKTVSLRTFSVETHQTSEQETFFPTRVKCPEGSPDRAFRADVGLVSPCICLCFGDNVLARDLVTFDIRV